LLLFFVAGTVLLFRSKHERHLILFMVRTQHFLKLIDWIAKLAPGFWRFIADLAIVVSFSGIGAAYLSNFKESRRNLDVILFFFGLVSVLVWAKSIPLGLVMAAVLLLGVFSLSKMKKPLYDFIAAAVIISSVLAAAMPWYLAGLEGCFGILAIVVGSLVKNAFDISVGDSDMPGVSPIIPWVEGGQWGFSIPGVGIFVPLWYGLASIVLLLFVHEFAHGILARVHGLELKSTGLLTLGALPIGAFVEPDETKFKGGESIARMRVLAMGSFANLILAIAAVFLFALLVAPAGSWIVAESNTASVPNGTAILSIDDVDFSDVSYVGAAMESQMFSNQVYVIKESAFGNVSGVNVTTASGTVSVAASELAGLKIRYVPAYRFDSALGGVLAGLFFWMYFFNFNVALVNLLPVVPFDGGKMILELLTVFRFSEEHIKKAVYLLLAAGLVVLLINAYPLLYLAFEWVF
jgi:membrane-associated protease RseP (regulator of RpoE activity)